jgi:hypothetical protein
MCIGKLFLPFLKVTLVFICGCHFNTCSKELGPSFPFAKTIENGLCKFATSSSHVFSPI